MKLYKITTQYKITKDGKQQNFVKAFFTVAENPNIALANVASKSFVKIPNVQVDDLQVCTIDEIPYTDLQTSLNSFV